MQINIWEFVAFCKKNVDKHGKIKKGILSFVLSFAMVMSVMMTMIPAMEIKAADDYTLLKNTTTVVTFDNKEWYLIDYDDSTVVTLLSKECVAAYVNMLINKKHFL